MSAHHARCGSALLSPALRDFSRHATFLVRAPFFRALVIDKLFALLHVLLVVHSLAVASAIITLLLRALSQSQIASVVHMHIAILLWSTLAECLSVDAIALCVLLRLPERDPVEAVFESTCTASRSRSCSRCVWLCAKWSHA